LEFDWAAEQLSGPIDSTSGSYFDDAFSLHSTVNDELHNTLQAFDCSDTDFTQDFAHGHVSVSFKGTEFVDDWVTGSPSPGGLDISLASQPPHTAGLDRVTSFSGAKEVQIANSQNVPDSGSSLTHSSPSCTPQRSAHLHSTKSSELPNLKAQVAPQRHVHSFKHMTSTFESKSSGQASHKSRKSYEKNRRQEVALMRRVKPCTRCRARKVSVSLGNY
jgi:hypothetical protein